MPDAFTVQQPLPYSCTPRHEARMIGNRPSVLRLFAIADFNGDWHVMPGGFTRLAAERQSTVSMQFGGSSVDTWVLSSQPHSTFSLLPSPLKPGVETSGQVSVVPPAQNHFSGYISKRRKVTSAPSD